MAHAHACDHQRATKLVWFTALLTMTVGVPLTAEDAVLLLDVGSTQDDVLTPLSVRLANPASTGEEAILERARERERGREREGERERERRPSTTLASSS